MVLKIIVDTREQLPLFTTSTASIIMRREKLDVGDYSLEGEENNIAIERKTLPDLFGTLGSGHERFKRELERAQSLKYFAIVIEGSYDDIVTENFNRPYKSKMRGYVVAKILVTLNVKYGINIFFAENRVKAKRMVKDIFEAYQKVHMK